MSDVEAILSKRDMETPRTPRELCEWVDAKSSELSESIEGKLYARSGALLPKKLWEEVRPLGLFALHRYGPDKVTCVPSLDNKNFDGRIDFDSPTPSVFVEITYAKDGYDERLRLDVLSKEGSVSGVGRITVSGTKAVGNHKIIVANEAVSHINVRNNALSLINKRLAGKSKKTYGSRHILVVVIDDYLPFRADEDKKILLGSVRSMVTQQVLDFGAVYLLGSTGGYYVRVSGEI